MRIKCSLAMRVTLVFMLIFFLTITSTQLRADTGTCGGRTTTLPFTDVPASNGFFCSIAAAFFSGLTNGTTPTTYSPAANVTREQMAAFITRTMDQGLIRGNRRAALSHWSTSILRNSFGETVVGNDPEGVKSDGADLWVANRLSGTVSRVRASDGKTLETWTGAATAHSVVVARGRVFVAAALSPGKLYMLDPTQPPGPVTTLSSSLGNNPSGIDFDGRWIWTANNAGNSVSRYDLNTGLLISTTGFNLPGGIVYDGTHMWLSDSTDGGSVKKLDPNGFTLQTLRVGVGSLNMAFDGINLWVTNYSSDSVTVVRIKDAQGNSLPLPPDPRAAFVVATLSGNGLNRPLGVAFDGQRILVANLNGDSVSLWKAADLRALGSIPTFDGDGPWGVCSDGINFWVTLSGRARLKRF